jgi:hypothetical protein
VKTRGIDHEMKIAETHIGETRDTNDATMTAGTSVIRTGRLQSSEASYELWNKTNPNRYYVTIYRIQKLVQKRQWGPEGEGPERNGNIRDEKISSGRFGNYKRLRQAVNNTVKHESDPFGQVINLSNFKFTVNEYKLLGYNLNFVPTPETINKNELLHDIKRFNRRIKLRSHFGTLPKEGLYFKSNSTWEPTNIHHTVKTFTEDFSRKIRNSLETQKSEGRTNRKNLNKMETRALENLKNRDDIVITKADKGGAVVINSVKDYIKEADRQLADKNFYKKLSHNPTSEHAALVDNAIDNLKLRGVLEEKTAEKLKTDNPKTPRFYLLPKIHKPNNPGRPVVSSIGCHTEKISQYIDHHLQPLNKALPSYVQDR